MFTVVLYCWCHSDSASVLLYFTFQFVLPADAVSAKPTTGDKALSVRKREGLRIQDKELLEMSDEGMCLSMHQPWASLLVQGIKV